jgi:hypothetical protein
MSMSNIITATEPFALCKSCCEKVKWQSVSKIRRTSNKDRLPCVHDDCEGTGIGFEYWYVGKKASVKS